jgi:hypothetical protein
MRRYLAALVVLLLAITSNAAETRDVDVCIYAATPAGITAAVTAKQEGCSVVIVEPSRWLGGILGAGIKPKQDCPELRAVGGLTKSKIFEAGNDPPTIRGFFESWLAEAYVPVIYEHRVARAETKNGRIVSIQLEGSPPDEYGVPPATGSPPQIETVRAKVFIDCSYEGDLMKAAGVQYAVGRESRDTYNEEPAGVGPPTNWTPLAFREGTLLLKLIDWDHERPLGAGDNYTQAYNFRFYTTTDPDRRAPFTKPEDYDSATYELVGRYVEWILKEFAGNQKEIDTRLSAIFPGWMNSGEYNYQRKSLITIAPLGESRFYQDGIQELRTNVWQSHIDYLRGLHYFLSTDPRVPEAFRKKTAEIGLLREMHPDTHGWPNQLYIRISRRMQGPYILTHADVLNTTNVSDGVGLALYGVDTYPVRRYLAKHPETGEQGVATEGNMFLGGSKGTGKPYAVPYRSITPKAEECTNLLVPVCFSASYIAYASARMEPVFCVLGESAGVAAATAVRESKDVQAIDVAALQSRLRERGQVLSWPPAEAD